MSKPLQKDSFYFFEQVFFKVEDTLFCVPKHGLNMPGTPFETIFSIPTVIMDITSSSVNTVPDSGKGEPHVPRSADLGEPSEEQHEYVEGNDEAHPIVSKSICARGFRQFLQVLYPLPGNGGPPWKFDDWQMVLNLATMWEFHRIRQQAIDSLTKILDPMNPVYSVLLGKKYRVRRWLDLGYHRLVSQASVDHQFLLQAGMDYKTVCDVLSVRENLASARLSRGQSSEVVVDSGKNTKERGCSYCQRKANCPYRRTAPNWIGNYVCRKCGTELKALENIRRRIDIAAAVDKVFAGELASL